VVQTLIERRHLEKDQVIGVLGVHLDQATEKLVGGSLGSIGGMEFIGNYHQYFGERDAAFVRAFREKQPEICIVNMDDDRPMALQTVEYLRRSSSGPISVFGVSSHMDSDSIIEAMRAGCTEYLAHPLRPDRLASALAEIARKRRELPDTAAQGKIITLLGVKGGVGTTTLAVHLAHALAKSDKKTLLIDDHSHLGDATLHLGLDDRHFGFHELIRNVQRMDAELLQGFVLKHGSGLDLLASPESLDVGAHFTPQAMLQTLRALVRNYEYIIIDARSGMDELNMAVIESSDRIYLVANPGLPDIRNTSRYIQYLGRLGFPAASTHIVLNKTSRNSAVSLDRVEKVLRLDVSVQIPLSVDDVTNAINTGVPVGTKSKSEFAQNVSKWARRLVDVVDEKPGQQQAAKSSRSKLSLLGIST
jgi:pilus assembly protein CpaE